MSKDLLNKIRGAIDNNEAPEPVKPNENKEATAPIAPVENPKAAKESRTPASPKPAPKKQVAEQPAPGSSLTSFEELQNILKAEKEGFNFNRRLVYVDDNIGEALDLLRKEAKINSNVLTSYLLKQFLLQNKELIKALREKKRDNIFFDWHLYQFLGSF